MMKNLLAALVLVVATPAMATTATWGGQSSTFNDGCEFKLNNAGQMALSGTTWTVTNPALLKIKTRGVGNIKVTSDNKLRKASGNNPVVDTATVNYTGTLVTGANNGGVVNINQTDISIGNLNAGNGVKNLQIELRGTAVMSDTDELVSATNYVINHTVTCTQ